MKNVAFLSTSLLSHNLIKAVFPLIEKNHKNINLKCFSDTNALSLLGRSFSLALIDWNVLASLPNRLNILNNFTNKKGRAPWILLIPRSVETTLTQKDKEIFDAILHKPFPPEELAQMIEKNL